MQLKRHWFSFLSILIICIMLPLFTNTVHAAEEQKKIRIGYMLYDGYQNGREGEVKSGSAYEYYQKIKSYTNWEYEYVYGSVKDLFTMLENGEIDVMACVTQSEERLEKYMFSDEYHGMETYFLYTHKDNTEITPADLSTLNGKNVGITQGTYQETYFRNWCQEKNINCNIVCYDYIDDLRASLAKNEVDAIIEVRVLTDKREDTPWKSIYRFGSVPLYFAVSKTRPDILQELNDAQAYIITTDEYYGYESMKKYHDGVNYHNAYLNQRQKTYLEGSGVLKVGYLEGTNPLSFTDPVTGKMSGLCAEYLAIMSEAYGMKFETTAYTDENVLIDELRAGTLDIVFPIGMGYWAAEERNVSLSISICNLPMTAVYMDIGADETFGVIAVNKYSPSQLGYAMQHYPDAEIYYVENTEEALNAVEKGKADVYLVRSSSLDFLNKEYEIYDRFRTMSVLKDMEAFMATRTQDTTLSIIMDKGISLLTEAQKDSAGFRYTYAVEDRVSLWQAIKDNIGIVIILIVVIILICTIVVVIFRLRSNKEHMQQLIVERDKAEKAEQAKTEFLSQMSHDIRTPMNAIIGFTNFIKEENDLKTVKEDYVPKIEMASNHLLMLINDVLEMSRIDTGKLVFNRENHDIQEIVESVVTVMRMQAEDKKLHLVTDISIKDHIVKCDQNHISRVIMNLLSNAVKFTPAGGTVSVSVHQQPEAPEGFAAYEIKVADTGIGMDPEFMKKVFEPFERERTSTVSGMQGTGLGMAIVKRIVDASGDKITVESTPGKGTTCTVHATLILGNTEKAKTLVKKDCVNHHHSLEQLKSYFMGRRILLVEDNEFNSTIAYTILENAGFLVETAENGQDAVHMVVNAPFSDYYDVILMDIQMPVMDGYEATKAIRALEGEKSRVKIIAVTANAFESDREKAVEAGMDAHVSKPLNVDELYNALLEVTEVE